jgi:hypothetical protein
MCGTGTLIIPALPPVGRPIVPALPLVGRPTLIVMIPSCVCRTEAKEHTP